MKNDGFIEIRYVPDPYRMEEKAFRIEINEQIIEKLQPLSRDREIMDEMKDDSWYARLEHERNMKRAEERQKAIDRLSNVITYHVKQIIESQDTINGYKQGEL